ncbi:sensor histidine kinase [Pseudoduganella aquatica]|uniref:Histidine kinase/HSP90-like ATPase domain-containing protein n=1 Tax=Pseudoduganella aquatica TaxID=2660641 RepID=A0A7X4HAL3_9BURK|nr:sensor histidine kinase [Pseudoduganella aquatica]MYN07716.1 hypothetical protein [Pseudoduganella aquatica]
MPGLFRYCLLIACLCFASAAPALNPDLSLASYRHDKWPAADGGVRHAGALAQTPDGWLWQGSSFGLYRYDGVHFQPFQPRNGGRLLKNNVSALQPAPNGDLWIGYGSGGLSLLRNGELTHILSTPEARAVFCLELDGDGTLWAATGQGGLLRYRNGKLERMDDKLGYPDRAAYYVLHDSSGRLWVTSGTGLYLFNRSKQVFERIRDVGVETMMLESADARVWMVQAKQVMLLASPQGVTARVKRSYIKSSYQSVFDDDGNFWTGNCPAGLCRLRPRDWQSSTEFSGLAATERFSQPWEMTSLQVYATMVDREGSLWVSTTGGMERLRHNKVNTLDGIKDGFSSMAEDSDGTVWLATSALDHSAKLWRVTDGQAVLQPNPYAHTRVATGMDGSLLLAGRQALERRGRDGVSVHPLPPGTVVANAWVSRLGEDRHGVWIGTTTQVLLQYAGSQWHPEPLGPGGYPITMSRARDGEMWFGTKRATLQAGGGSEAKIYGVQHGIDSGSMQFINANEEILLGTDRVLQVLQGEKFHTLSFADAGAIGISGMLTDALGDRWFNTQQGLRRVRAADWRKSMAKPTVPLPATLFDRLDGYVGDAVTGARRPAALRTRDGRLWFSTGEGVAWLDPLKLPVNRVPPPSEITMLSSGGYDYQPADVRSFPAGTEALAIHYAAMSFATPERVTFRYRLTGVDRDWQQAGPRRTAYYNNLAPGSYRFEVQATNEDGVQGPPAPPLVFDIGYRFNQTWWFKAAMAALAAGVLYLLYRWRLRRATARIEERVHAQLEERERIARTLHDTFLQGVYGLVLRIQAVAAQLPEGKARSALETAMQRADQLLDEGREQVHCLRNATPPSLSLDAALRMEAQAIESEYGIKVTASLELPPVSAEVADELYAICRQALANAARHSHGSLVELAAQHAGGWLKLSVKDNGKGMPEHVSQGQTPGHYGIVGMRERAAAIGAELAIASGPDGTEITLSLPVPD